MGGVARSRVPVMIPACAVFVPAGRGRRHAGSIRRCAIDLNAVKITDQSIRH
jgi:hypothetical protein